ncbi:MAG: hypothetical protein II932_07955, partial [Treponema sp.]|nr:hypothetical protein [Treponema sp.]
YSEDVPDALRNYFRYTCDDHITIMDDIRLPLGRGSGKPAYSPNTLLMSLEEGVTEEQVYKLAEKYDMEILYLYQNFNMCAAKLPRDYSDAEFKVLLRQLGNEPEVLEASRDGMMYLY